MNEWDWRTPEPLSAEKPVLQSILNRSRTHAFRFKRTNDCGFGLISIQPIETITPRIDHPTQTFEGSTRDLGILVLFLRKNLHNRNVVLLGEVIVALIMSGYRHHRTCAVRGYNEIAGVNWDGLPSERIRGIATQEDSFLVAKHVDSIKLRNFCTFIGQLSIVCFKFGSFHQIFTQWVFRCKRDECHSKDGVWASCKRLNDFITIDNWEMDIHTMRAPNPISLHGFDVLREFNAL